MTDLEYLNNNKQKRQVVECWSRVMGYFRPTSSWNLGKKSEFKDRVYFTEEQAFKRINEKSLKKQIV